MRIVSFLERDPQNTVSYSYRHRGMEIGSLPDVMKEKTEREWYTQLDLQIKQKIYDNWVKEMEELESNVPFFSYVKTFLLQEGFQNHFVSYPAIEVNKTLHKKWILYDNTSVNTIHPPPP